MRTIQAATEPDELVVAVAKGRTNAEIADEFHISLGTGKAHIGNLMTKLAVRNRVADLVIVVCRTNEDGGHGGMSLLVVERAMPGFERGKKIEKIGLHSNDTAELFSSDVRVPSQNLLGEEGRGYQVWPQPLRGNRPRSCSQQILLTLRELGEFHERVPWIPASFFSRHRSM